jgi:hypothetical protein
MKGTYIINYMNGERRSIELDIGDVLYFSNAFEHGGGAYVIDTIENPLKIDKVPAHYRLFMCYHHEGDCDKISFTFTEK